MSILAGNRCVILMRHGQAVPVHPAGDHARWLTPTGRAQAKTVATFLQQKGVAPEFLCASDYVRAVQTLEVVSEPLAAEVARCTDSAFRPEGRDALGTLRTVMSTQKPRTCLIVSHETCVSELFAALLGTSVREPFGLAETRALRIDQRGAGELFRFAP